MNKNLFVLNFKRGFIIPLLVGLIILICTSSDAPVIDLIIRGLIIMGACFLAFALFCFLLAEKNKEINLNKMLKLKSKEKKEKLVKVKKVKPVKEKRLKIKKPKKIRAKQNVSQDVSQNVGDIKVENVEIDAKEENVIQNVSQIIQENELAESENVIQNVSQNVLQNVEDTENNDSEKAVKVEIVDESSKIKEENVIQNVSQNVLQNDVKKVEIKQEHVIQNDNIEKCEIPVPLPKVNSVEETIQHLVNEPIEVPAKRDAPTRVQKTDFIRKMQINLNALKKKIPKFSESSKATFSIGETEMDFDSDDLSKPISRKCLKVDDSTDIDDCRLFEIAKRPEIMSSHELKLITENSDVRKRYETFLKKLSENFDKHKASYYLKRL